MNNTKFRAVFFDLDGTLMDTAQDIIPCIRATAAARGYAVADYAAICAHMSAGSRKMMCVATGLEDDDPALEALIADFHAAYGQTPLKNHYFPGIEALLEKLEHAAIPWGLITNKNTRFATILCEQAQLTPRLSALVCGDTLPRSKPHPDPLLFACAHLNLSPAQCLFIGDSPVDVQAARAANMPVAACNWGYIPPGESPVDWGADYLVRHAGELESLIWNTSV